MRMTIASNRSRSLTGLILAAAHLQKPPPHNDHAAHEASSCRTDVPSTGPFSTTPASRRERITTIFAMLNARRRDRRVKVLLEECVYRLPHEKKGVRIL